MELIRQIKLLLQTRSEVYCTCWLVRGMTRDVPGNDFSSDKRKHRRNYWNWSLCQRQPCSEESAIPWDYDRTMRARMFVGRDEIWCTDNLHRCRNCHRLLRRRRVRRYYCCSYAPPCPIQVPVDRWRNKTTLKTKSLAIYFQFVFNYRFLIKYRINFDRFNSIVSMKFRYS